MSDDDVSDEEIFSITSSKTIYKRSRSQTTRSSSLDDRHFSPELQDESYLPVTRWAVDYNNKNYIRSQCNKNTGLHRQERGRPADWQIQYDNSYFTRSKVNAPKGLHRQIPEIPRKYAPDKDELADATGWEFDCGPEFDQVEEDVPYIPEGRIIARGCYRWYGVKRNDSDCDRRQQEYREPVLSRSAEGELKYGQEFLQADIPHMAEEKERRYTRGGYRHYEVMRNAYDINPEEMSSAAHDPEWRRKHHSNGFRYLDIEMCKYDRDDISGRYPRTIKGKPFRRTILQKVYELRKTEDSSESIPRRPATRLSLVPGEGQKTVYEGVPDRHGQRGTPSSMRSVYGKKGKTRSDFEEFEKERGYKELTPEQEERLHKMVKSIVREAASRKAEDKREQHRKSHYREDDRRQKRGSGKFHEYGHEVQSESTVHRLEVDKGRYHDDRYHEKERKSPGKRQVYYEDRDYPSGDIVIQKKKSHTEEYRVTKRGGRDRSKDHDRNIHHEQHKKGGRREEDYDDRREGGRRFREYEERKEGSRRSGEYGDLRQSPAEYRKKGSSRKKMKDDENYFDVDIRSAKDKAGKKLPPHVESRMQKIRDKMERKMEEINKTYTDESSVISESEYDIDLMKHKGHPHDRGETHNSEYEKYVTKNGSEIWIKKEESFAELHHKH